jgi:glucokinase
MNHDMVIGIDLGGTNVRAGLIHNDKLSDLVSMRINSSGTVEEVLNQVFTQTDKIVTGKVKAIGIGVPGLVDLDKGIVYDVVNIPSWKKVHLKQLMEERYNIPVLINNDANCFALGEHYFGKGKGKSSMVGLTIGTGLGAGIILNNKLYAGPNCGAGEFGMVDYLDKYYEYYASGQFFQNVYNIDGQEVYKKAGQGDKQTLKMYEEMGVHLGNAVKMILYTYDAELIIIGGSLKNAWNYYSPKMWERIKTLAFTKPLERLRIELSELEYPGVLGAAALHFDTILD